MRTYFLEEQTTIMNMPVMMQNMCMCCFIKVHLQSGCFDSGTDSQRSLGRFDMNETAGA